MKLYRVFPHDPSAALTDKGGALYVPRSAAGRADNPALYAALYVADSPEAAIAEAFGRLPLWRPADFIHASGNCMTLATYDVPDALAICDVDDINVLAQLGIGRPGRIITPDRKVTQVWARQIYETGRYTGVQWWCYYNPEWRSFALWDIGEVAVEPRLERLDAKHPTVNSAAAKIIRQIDPKR